LRHREAAPDLFAIDLRQVPVAWAQALAERAWGDLRIGEGRLDGALAIRVPEGGPMHLQGELALGDGAFDTTGARQAGAGLGARVALDWLALDEGPRIAIDGELRGGELLFGSGYFVLPDHPVQLHLRAQGRDQGWTLGAFSAIDPGVLELHGHARLGDAGLEQLAVSLRSDDVSPLPQRYLSG